MRKVFIFLVLAVISIACTAFVSDQQSNRKVTIVTRVSSNDHYVHYVENVGDHYHHIYVTTNRGAFGHPQVLFVVIDNQK